MGSLVFTLGKVFQAIGLLLVGAGLYRGVFFEASMDEEIQWVGAGLLFFFLGWVVLGLKEKFGGN